MVRIKCFDVCSGPSASYVYINLRRTNSTCNSCPLLAPTSPVWVAVGDVGACSSPKVTSQTYSTGDELMSTEVVFIVEVEAECERGEVRMKRKEGGGGWLWQEYVMYSWMLSAYFLWLANRP